MEDQDQTKLLLRIATGLERIAAAFEQYNAQVEKTNRCPTCRGDGKGYGEARCIRCGGSGIRPEATVTAMR